MSIKVRKVFVCRSCGAQSPKWTGKCPACGEWNTYQEEVLQRDVSNEPGRDAWKISSPLEALPQPVALDAIRPRDTPRLRTPDEELNRVLGGGIVPGSLVLIGGQPGIGKSTLLLQLALRLGGKVLYIAGEESEDQIKMRADRLGERTSGCHLLSETNVTRICTIALGFEPDLIIADSIQTLSVPYLDATPGSISQIRECAGEFQRFAKSTNIPVFLIGHITKDGSLAGPKLLEHVVDTVLQFEGEQHYTYRMLRTIKNRFGSTDEMGIYEMQAGGLRQVSNPSELLLSQHGENLSGSAVAATQEGMRPMLIETQALVTKAVYGTPQRSATGFDLRRLGMLLAVLEKRGGLPFGMRDVFLNIAGGIRVDDPGIDLAIVAALLSSLEDVALPRKSCFVGEVGLSGEIRAVNRIDQRIQEADRLGFETMYLSRYNLKGLDAQRFGIKLETFGRLEELYAALFP